MSAWVVTGVVAVLGAFAYLEGQYIYQRMRRQDDRIESLLSRVETLEGENRDH